MSNGGLKVPFLKRGKNWKIIYFRRLPRRRKGNSVTRCWNQKLPNCFLKVSQIVATADLN